MDDHFDICRVLEMSKFDIARLTCRIRIYHETEGQLEKSVSASQLTRLAE